MQVRVEKDSRFPVSISGNEIIKKNLPLALYKIPRTNRHIAIHTRYGMPISNIDTIITTDYKDEPLWKQQMHLQMGMRPRKVARDNYERVVEIPLEGCEKYKFEVYISVV